MLEERRKELFEKIREFIHGDGTEDIFNSLSLEVFEYQYNTNEAYRGYCERKGIKLQDVTSWVDIPAYPSDGFKNEIIVSFPLEKMVMEILTSGTTCPELRGSVFRDEYGMELALGSNRNIMGEYLFPEGERMPILVLAPSPQMVPTMGMAVGMAETIKHFGTDESDFFITKRGLRLKEFLRKTREFEQKSSPIAIIGSTSAFVYIFNECKAHGIKFSLPKGSRIADGGGYRGKFGECTREMYYRQCFDIFGIPEEYCVNVLGMAECATNFIDSSLKDHLNGIERVRLKPNHNWAKVAVVDIKTCSRPVPEGEVGLLRHYDLTGLPTVIAVQTDNLGYQIGDGFEIIGRAKIVEGKVSPVPSEKPVGPMGDKKIFPFLDAYMKFSIKRQMAKIKKDDTICPCGESIEDMLAGMPESE